METQGNAGLSRSVMRGTGCNGREPSSKHATPPQSWWESELGAETSFLRYHFQFDTLERRYLNICQYRLGTNIIGKALTQMERDVSAGAPLGPPVTNGTVVTRRFESGAVARYDLATKDASVVGWEEPPQWITAAAAT